MLRSFAVVAALACVSAHARADDLFTRHFAGVDGGKACYARSYGAAHLQAHPKQTIRKIEIDFDQAERTDGKKNSGEDFQAGIGFVLRRSSEKYGQLLYCKTVAEHFECYLDADGGQIRLTPSGSGLRLEVAGGGGGTDQIVAEGEKDFGEFGGKGSDDRIFILPRAKRSACDEAGQ
jgi:hypothetical protein